MQDTIKMMNTPFVSIIIPCRNEEHFIGKVIENLLQQDYDSSKVEILFIDGRSTDKTREVIQSYISSHSYMKLLDNPAGVVPHALNEGIRKSKGELIIRMDAHSVYPGNYISQLVYWQRILDADNVGGMWITKPGAETTVANAISVALSHPFGIGNARYRLGSKEAMEVDTVPFGCYRREVFDKIGLFDEQLIRNQDDEFNGRLKKYKGKIFLVPGIKLIYYSRSTVSKLSMMYYQYGLFKPLVNVKLGFPATARQLAPLALVMSLLISGFISLFIPSLSWTFLLVGGFYLLINLIFSIQLAMKSKWNYLFYLVLIFPCIHFSYGFGYLKGIVRFVLFRSHRYKTINVSVSR
jgi:glycosyltransferase involved in cell wall biosynthesis